MIEETSSKNKSRSSISLIYTAAFVILGLWFAYEIISILFLFFLGIVLTLILNAPTMWLVTKKVPRTFAAIIVFFVMLLFLFFMGWLIIPRMLEEGSTLLSNIPNYISDLRHQLSSMLSDYPSLQQKLLGKEAIKDNLPEANSIIKSGDDIFNFKGLVMTKTPEESKSIIKSLGRFSFSLIGGAFMIIVFFSIVIYMLIDPAPLIETYLMLFPEEKRQKAAQALAKASVMLNGWIWSNLLAGTMEAIATYFFLTYMEVPGVWVWTGLALFAELVPKLGLYIMAVPPVLITLSISPMTALWVLIFYLILNEIMGDLVIPRIRASTMNLHPVSTLFSMLALASAFGLIGALIATPLTAFVKAYYETFYVPTVSKENIKDQVNMVLARKEKN